MKVRKNMSIANVIALFGGVALFLFGMNLMGEGLKKVAGNKLELVLWKLTGTPLKGILLGTIVTAVIQSSSATSAMVVGFVNSGMMTVVQSISIVMGANIGTSITGWILCLSGGGEGGGTGLAALLSTATLTSVIALIGIVCVMFSKSMTKKNVGNIMLGFSVLMYGMSAMSSAVSPLKESDSFKSLLTMFDNPILGILVGILITSVLQSNSASVGILQVISVTGAISYGAAFPMIMGMGIGASMPVLISAIGANRDGKRTALIYLLINVFGTIACTILFYGANAVFKFSFMQEKTAIGIMGIAVMNTLYRIAAIIVLAPFMKYLERITDFLMRKQPVEEKRTLDVDRLEERFIAHPALAIAQSQESLYHMADIAEENLFRSFDLLKKFDEEQAKIVDESEDIVDRYEDKLGTYLVKLTGCQLEHSQTIDVSMFLHTIGDFERISDHSENIMEVAREIREKDIHFSSEAVNELETLEAAIRQIVTMTFKAFEERDLELAYRVEPLEDWIDSLCQTAKLNHIARVQAQSCTLQQGFVFNDLLANFERVADHCSNIAVALIELNADSFDTHEYLNEIKNVQNEAFTKYYKEYQKEYSFHSVA